MGRLAPLFWFKTPIYYRPKFLRHLNHLAINGFYARELDADDHEFLEGVRRRGIANGTVPNTGIDLLEARDFWQFPYAVEPGVQRRAGPTTVRDVPTPEQEAIRKARSVKFRAARAAKHYDALIAAIELDRERREWQQAQERRKWREVTSDAEWAAAEPGEIRKRRELGKAAKRKFGDVVNGHYVPQWKLDERGELNPYQLEEKAKQEKLEAARQQREAARQQREAELAEREARRQERLILQAHAARRAAEAAQRTINQSAAAPVFQHIESLKGATLRLILSRPGYEWSVDALMRAIGFDDRAMMVEAVQALIDAGRVRFNKPHPTSVL